ncbi:excisionase family DNA binding protein [Streptomyces nodosus]|nr:excisionase family DNA binding protein [Streptomyces nodosus]
MTTACQVVPAFLTVMEVASVMRVSKMTVYRLVHSGHLLAIHVGRAFRVPEQAVHECLRESYPGVEAGGERPSDGA